MKPPSQNSTPQSAYTNAPLLHPGLLVGSLQLLFWLVFHPPAWHNHLGRLDTTLPLDFCLAGLGRAQWSNAGLRRLLVMTHLVWPFLATAVAAGLWWAAGRPAAQILLLMVGGLAAAVASSLIISFFVNLPFGVVAGPAIILGQAGLPLVLLLSLAASLGATLTIYPATHQAERPPTYSLARRAGGVVVGVLTSGLVYVLAIWTANIALQGVVRAELALAAFYGLVSTVVFGWRTGHWGRGLAFAAVTTPLLALALMVLQAPSPLAENGAIFALAEVPSNAVQLFLRAGNTVALAGTLLGLSYLLARWVGGREAGAVAVAGMTGGVGVFASGLIAPFWPTLLMGLLVILLGLTLPWWRPVVSYPFQVLWNFLLLRGDEQGLGKKRRPPRLRQHAAFWDSEQPLRFLGLHEHLVLVMEHDPAEARAALEFLARSRQRWAAREAQIELDARQLAGCQHVAAIGQAHQALAAGELAGPGSALLRSFSRASRDVAAGLQQESPYNQRLALSAVEERLDGLVRELTRSSEPYAARFRPVAGQWREVVAGHVHQLAAEADARQEIDNPYIIGVPLSEQQALFVGRTDISGRIEQLLLDRRRPPILLYGQRRMGKTSLLNNLSRLLPSTIVPLFVDLQGPASRAAGHAGFLYNLARGLANAGRQHGLVLPPLSREALASDPFTIFDEWLDSVEAALGARLALLALDELEALEEALGTGRFEEGPVLGMLRHLIQHRPKFKVLLSASHTLEELQRWSSYLINVQVVQVGYLQENEARQLIERPVQGFALRYQPEAVARVLALTRCHPFLVQLLCAEIVALKNEQAPAVRRLATVADVEAAVPEALGHGSFFFADIERNQVDAAGAAFLRSLAGKAADQQQAAPPELRPTLERLVQRELIEPTGNGYRFQVELIGRWFR
ncbi:MAG: ATP-binding protein [Chloroflexi bacterium]|nr:ATP-binding protein [Chloroflexota bacterium]